MGISAPRKKRIAFWLVGLLVVVVLANVLWHFQDDWLTFWLPEQEAAPPVVVQAGDLPVEANVEEQARWCHRPFLPVTFGVHPVFRVEYLLFEVLFRPLAISPPKL